MKNITHILFDNDGLLIDTEGMYSKMMQNILDGYGKKFNNEIKAKMMGRPTREAGKCLIDSLNLPMTVDEYEEKLYSLRSEFFPSSQLMPGAEMFINNLKIKNIPIAVATSSDAVSFELKIQNHKELYSKFLHIVCGSDKEIKNGKPAPDIYLLGMSRFKNPPKVENVLVFEDALLGVQAGLAAGMQVVWVVDMRYTSLTKHEIEAYKTDQLTIIYHLQDFKPEMFNLPSF